MVFPQHHRDYLLRGGRGFPGFETVQPHRWCYRGCCRRFSSSEEPLGRVRGLFTFGLGGELSLDRKQVRASKIVKGARKRVKACSLVEGQADRLGWIKKLAESLGYWVDIGYKVMRLTR